MTSKWLKQKKHEQRMKRHDYYRKIVTEMEKSGLFTREEIFHILREIVRNTKFLHFFSFTSAVPSVIGKTEEEVKLIFKQWKVLSNIQKSINKREFLLSLVMDWNRYLDSQPVRMRGDIIITDPCYVLKDDAWDNDGNVCLSALGINGDFRDTLYGDWSCTVYRDEKEIGSFCADAGLVAFMSLADLLKHNPDVSTKNNHKQTVIRNFDGEVHFEIKDYETDDGNQDFFCKVVGHGVDMLTGEAFNFESLQTGF